VASHEAHVEAVRKLAWRPLPPPTLGTGTRVGGGVTVTGAAAVPPSSAPSSNPLHMQLASGSADAAVRIYTVALER
jgi:hypothetical protein